MKTDRKLSDEAYQRLPRHQCRYILVSRLELECGAVGAFVAISRIMTISKATPGEGADWRNHLIDSSAGIRQILESTRRIAVLGIKDGVGKPAFFVPEYAQRAGYEIVPVPVYYPDVTEMLGAPVYRTLSAIPGDIDMVNVFRRPQDIPPHVEDIVAKRPKAVWFQSGIVNHEAAERFARAGIDVVQNRCLMVELGRIGR